MSTMKPEIRAVLFDKDGTLIDYELSWGPTNRRAAAFAASGDRSLETRLLALGGVDPQSGRTRADSLFASGNTREIATCFADAGSPIPADALASALDAIFVAAVDEAVPVADLGEVFATLRRHGMVIGIASSDNEAAIRAMVERFGLAEHVAFVAGYDSGYGTKPGPGMLTAFASATGIPAGQIAVVGDNLHDMRMAAAGRAGQRIAVLTGTGQRDTLSAEADLCLPSIRSLEFALGFSMASVETA